MGINAILVCLVMLGGHISRLECAYQVKTLVSTIIEKTFLWIDMKIHGNVFFTDTAGYSGHKSTPMPESSKLKGFTVNENNRTVQIVPGILDKRQLNKCSSIRRDFLGTLDPFLRCVLHHFHTFFYPAM